jgi:hypothetical protein
VQSNPCFFHALETSSETLGSVTLDPKGDRESPFWEET